MPLDPFDEPCHVEPVDGEVTLRGPGPTGVAMTPQAARETAARLAAAAARAEQGHVERIDAEDTASLARWARRLGVEIEVVRATVIAVGPDSEAVALRLTMARAERD